VKPEIEGNYTWLSTHLTWLHLVTSAKKRPRGDSTTSCKPANMAGPSKCEPLFYSNLFVDSLLIDIIALVLDPALQKYYGTSPPLSWISTSMTLKDSANLQTLANSLVLSWTIQLFSRDYLGKKRRDHSNIPIPHRQSLTHLQSLTPTAISTSAGPRVMPGLPLSTLSLSPLPWLWSLTRPRYELQLVFFRDVENRNRWGTSLTSCRACSNSVASAREIPLLSGKLFVESWIEMAGWGVGWWMWHSMKYWAIHLLPLHWRPTLRFSFTRLAPASKGRCTLLWAYTALIFFCLVLLTPRYTTISYHASLLPYRVKESLANGIQRWPCLT